MLPTPPYPELSARSLKQTHLVTNYYVGVAFYSQEKWFRNFVNKLNEICQIENTLIKHSKFIRLNKSTKQISQEFKVWQNLNISHSFNTAERRTSPMSSILPGSLSKFICTPEGEAFKDISLVDKEGDVHPVSKIIMAAHSKVLHNIFTHEDDQSKTIFQLPTVPGIFWIWSWTG